MSTKTLELSKLSILKTKLKKIKEYDEELKLEKKKISDEIYYNREKIEEIIRQKRLLKMFGDLENREEKEEKEKEEEEELTKYYLIDPVAMFDLSNDEIAYYSHHLINYKKRGSKEIEKLKQENEDMKRFIHLFKELILVKCVYRAATIPEDTCGEEDCTVRTVENDCGNLLKLEKLLEEYVDDCHDFDYNDSNVDTKYFRPHYEISDEVEVELDDSYVSIDEKSGTIEKYGFAFKI
jgi:hypothetical protein